MEVTTGEVSDGRHLQKTVEQSKENGVKVEEICADSAYTTKTNLEYATENDISYFTAFVVNAKRIVKLLEQKTA